MIPVSDSVRVRSVPYVNLAIIVVNLLVFLYEVYLSQDVVRANVTELDLFIYEWGNVPACTFDELGREFSGSWSAPSGEGEPHPWHGARRGD